LSTNKQKGIRKNTKSQKYSGKTTQHDTKNTSHHIIANYLSIYTRTATEEEEEKTHTHTHTHTRTTESRNKKRIDEEIMDQSRFFCC